MAADTAPGIYQAHEIRRQSWHRQVRGLARTTTPAGICSKTPGAGEPRSANADWANGERDVR